MSKSLLRLVYVSRATFKPFNMELGKGLDGHVIKILNQSRRNNQKRNLVGALYYGNGCFFQCLEGEKSDIDTLYAILEQDPRHKDLKILSSNPIEERAFHSWEMKYATIDQEVRVLLRKYKFSKFDPYHFNQQMIDELVAMLQRADDKISTVALASIANELPELPVGGGSGETQYAKLLVVALFCAIILAAALYLKF
jgi:hypothetical protein